MALDILLFVAAFSVWQTSQPSFCALCHEMKGDISAWRESTHARVNCVTCHTPGLVNFMTHKAVALVTEVPAKITGDYEKPINHTSKVARVDFRDSTCERCHALKRKVTPSKGIKIDHPVHKKEGVKCANCHNRVAHPRMKGYENYASMTSCYRCHGLTKEAQAPGRCDTCHTPDFDLLPDSHKVANWRVPTHGDLARKDREPCLTCHLRSFCSDCHGGLAMPHPGNWTTGRRDHAKVGRANPQSCVRCHTQIDFCGACHHKGFDEAKGAWVSQHPAQVRKIGAATCFECHGPVYCAKCHVEGVKPKTIKG